MAYELQADESVPQGIMRVVLEELDRAIAELNKEDIDPHERVHEVRKRFKEIRAVLRLVRAPLGDAYKIENMWYRDEGRELSVVRDAQAILEAFDALRSRYEQQLSPNAFRAVREALEHRRQAVADAEEGLDQQLARLAEDLRTAQSRVLLWPIEAEDFAAISDGLAAIYAGGREAMAEAYRNPSPEHFHEWRKAIKHHWYHIQLLRGIWPTVMNGFEQAAHDLSDLVGDYHDLDVLRQTVLAERGALPGRKELELLIGLIESRQAGLKDRAHALGRRVYAEKAPRFIDRMKAYWEAWKEEATLREAYR